jgi:hypothetical protein
VDQERLDLHHGEPLADAVALAGRKGNKRVGVAAFGVLRQKPFGYELIGFGELVGVPMDLVDEDVDRGAFDDLVVVLQKERTTKFTDRHRVVGATRLPMNTSSVICLAMLGAAGNSRMLSLTQRSRYFIWFS